MQDLISSNVTVKHIEEVTEMPLGFLVGLTILGITIFVYLWIDAGKEDKTDILFREMKLLNRKTSRIEKKLRIRKARGNDVSGK